MDTSNQPTDHESILLLRQAVNAIQKSQDTFHLEMKQSIRDVVDQITDLRNDTVNRVKSLEEDHVGRGEFEEIKSWKTWTIAFGVGISVMIPTVAGLVSYIYITGNNGLRDELQRHEQQTSVSINK